MGYPQTVPRKPSLLQQIEQDALDSKASLADALRKCVALGGHAGSVKLRDWASGELNGYGTAVKEIPEYRKIVAPIVIDGFSGNYHVTGQQISAVDLPDVAREAGISEELPLVPGVGELEEMVRTARAEGAAIRLGLPGGATLAKLMTAELQDQFRAVERVYWKVSPTAVSGVLDQIRTRLVALVAEVRAAGTDPDAPSAAAVTNAVEVVVHGKARDININTAQVSGTGVAALETQPTERPWWRRAKVVGSFIVGAATIAAAVIAWLQWR